MNILMLSWRGPGHPEAGGAEASTHEHAKGWIKAGHSVTLFTSRFVGSREREDLDGIEIIRKGIDILGVQASAFFWYLFGDHRSYDLVVDEFHGIPFFTPLYVRVQKLAFIHEVAKEVWWLNPWPRPFNIFPGVFGPIFERVVFIMLYRNVPFMAVSDSTKADLVSSGIPEANITVVHNGVDKIGVSARKAREKTVMYLGALTKDKGVEDAISVFADVNKRDPSYQFWIVGKGENNYVTQLKDMAMKLGLGRNVKFLGHVSDQKRNVLLARAHILLNPSIREGWGLVNIEANSAGTPVVGYDVPGMRDSVLNNSTGRLVKYGDIDGLALAIMELCDDNTRYSKFRVRAMGWGKRFRWEKSVKGSLALIKEISTSL